MSQNDLIKLRIFLSFSLYVRKVFHERTKVIDDGQTHKLVLSISNLKDESKKLFKSHELFWLKSLKVIAVWRNAGDF